ncbi:MAG TPA: hypothetical protein VH834_20655 [Solirubrobacteraceae bacterium]
MLGPGLQLLLAPALVAASTLAARAWGERLGGVVSAFPVIVGPVLLIEAQTHGAAFAAHAAAGTLLGLAALSGFAVAYARAAQRVGWRASLAAGWAAAAAIGAVVAASGAGALAGPPVAAASLALAYRALPRGRGAVHAQRLAPPWDLPLRMAVTSVLVVALVAAADRLGPSIGGILAALPTLAGVLAVFTHRQRGAAAVAELLRGMLHGMAGFLVFCVLVAALVGRAGVPGAFAGAAFAAAVVQTVCTLRAGRRREGPDVLADAHRLHVAEHPAL